MPSDDSSDGGAELETAWLHSDRTYIRDSLDRVVVLRGVNARIEGIFDVTFDDGRIALEEVPAFSADDAARMHTLGFNVLRLPINWSAIEPEQGVFDEAYLDAVQTVVEHCADASVHVILDFHQDAYSKEIGEDGAPLWAIHPAPTELLEGPLGDSLSERRFSAQVLAAFDGFFIDDDEDTSDQWLQMAFAEMARHVAERFADEPWVLGYELYNEPVANDAYVWSFNERVVPLIREADTQHLILFEPNAARNFVETAPVSGAAFVDSQGVYAPHLYTLSFTGSVSDLEQLTPDELAPNMAAAVDEAASWQTPLFVGEWGVSPHMPNADLYVQYMYDLFDGQFAHSTVWLWKENSQGNWGFFDHDEATGAWQERPSVVAAHARVYATAIAGEPESMRYDADDKTFDLRYAGRDDGVASLLYVPSPPDYPAAFDVSCDGVIVADAGDRDPTSGLVSVVCDGAGSRHIEVRQRD